MNHNLFEKTLEKGSRGERLNREELLALADIQTPTQLHLLGQAALSNRIHRFGHRATYVFNLQINPSNICKGGCRFCHYSAKPGQPHAYTLNEDEILAKTRSLEPTEVHIVGGLNHHWDYRRNLALVERLHAQFPALYIKAYTAVEMDWFAECENLPVETVLERFRKAGLSGMPGGGAEVFSERIRAQTCPDKISPTRWFEIHKRAWEIGITTNATMLTGLSETLEERVDHLLLLREAQDDAGGFSAFIPLFYQPGRNQTPENQPTPLQVLATVGLSRLALDNIAHIKGYWPMMGLETASAALSWGADDMDGTLGEERIAHAGGAQTPKNLARNRMQETIRLGGFIPMERDGRFGIMKVETA